MKCVVVKIDGFDIHSAIPFLIFPQKKVWVSDMEKNIEIFYSSRCLFSYCTCLHCAKLAELRAMVNDLTVFLAGSNLD